MSTRHNKKLKYSVNGMQCSSCEVLIEKKISELKGISGVKASIFSKEIEIFCTEDCKEPKLEELNQALFGTGYSIQLGAGNDNKTKAKELINDVIIAATIVICLQILEKTAILPPVFIQANSTNNAFFIFGIMASISSCAAIVGSLLIALSNQWNQIYSEKVRPTTLPFIMFNIGRLISFAVLGGLLGLLGSYFKLSFAATSFLTIAIALLMLVLGFQMVGINIAQKIKIRTPKFISTHITNEKNFKGRYMPFVVGALTFFVPCGFTLIAQSNSLQTGSFLKSAQQLFSFALGTLPMLAVISFTSIKFHQTQKLSQTFNRVGGIIVIFFALYTLNAQLSLLPPVFGQGTSPSNLANAKPAVQYLQMESKGFAYYPKTATLRVGVPTIWEFYNSGSYGCAQSVAAPGLIDGYFNLALGKNTIKFTPQKTGTFKISCSMGMVPPVTITVTP